MYERPIPMRREAKNRPGRQLPAAFPTANSSWHTTGN